MKLFLFFLLCYPFLEIFAFVTAIINLGPTFVLLWVLLSAVLGVLMLRNKRIGQLITLGALLNQKNDISIYGLLWPIRYSLAGVLFILPGIISTIAAVLLLLPIKGPTVNAQQYSFKHEDSGFNEDGSIIDGEYTQENSADSPNKPARYLSDEESKKK